MGSITRLLIAICLASLAMSRDVDPVFMTFESPVRVPGVTLDPGGYLFAPDDAVGGQTVIDIYDTRRARLVASVLAMEVLRAPGARYGSIDYPHTVPAALRAWYPVGAHVGYEFVYGTQEATGIFRESGLTVPATAFIGPPRALTGVVPVAHVDAVREYFWILAAPRRDAEREPSPLDQLRLARLAIATHLTELSVDDQARLKLVDRQLRDLMDAFRARSARLPEQAHVALASVANVERALAERREARHVAERVAERVRLFAAGIR